MEQGDGYFLVEDEKSRENAAAEPGKKFVVHVVGLGDVGRNLAIGLRLLGQDCLETIGLFDIDESRAAYMARELNQIVMPNAAEGMPRVVSVSMENLCNCHVLVFAASISVPPVTASSEVKDVRMIQLASNGKLVRNYVDLCKNNKYTGRFFIVSDPIDPLCKIALDGFEGKLGRNQVSGFGLGVMYARAGYHAKNQEEFWQHGRVYGPHGKGLVTVNSLEQFDPVESKRIAQAAVKENLLIRDMGYKPNIAPAFSSGAISIVEMLRGNWQYSSVYFGSKGNGAFLGIRNKEFSPGVRMMEDMPLPDEVFSMIETSYNELAAMEL